MFQSALHRILRTLPAGLAILAAGAAFAGMPVTYKDGERALFRVEVPDFWTVRSGGERVLTPPSRDEPRLVQRVIGLQPTAGPKVWVGFISPEGISDFAGAEAYLADIGPFLVKDPETASTRRLRIGGLPARSFRGKGRRGGRTVDFVATVIDLPGGRMAVSVAIMEPGSSAAEIEQINAIYRSFRAAR